MRNKLKLVLIISLTIGLILIGGYLIHLLKPTIPTEQQLKQKFSELEAQYKEKKARGYDLSEVENLIKDAKQAYSSGDYKKTDELLDEAFIALKKAPFKPLPSPITTIQPTPPTPTPIEIQDWFSQDSFHLGMAGLNYDKYWDIYTQDRSYATEMLDKLEEQGIKWVNVRFCWHGIEPEPDVYDFSFYDWLVSEAEKRNMYIEGGITYWYEDWYDPNIGLTEEQLEDYCDVIEETVRHFKDKPIVWELVLGVEHAPERPVEEVAEYVLKVYEAAKRGDPEAYLAVAPRMRGIIVPETELTGDTKLERMGEKWYIVASEFCEVGARPNALGFRSYSASAYELESILQTLNSKLEKLSDTYGVERNLWGLEAGLKWASSLEDWEKDKEWLEDQGYVKEDFSYASEAQHIATRIFTLAANEVKFVSWHSYISYVPSAKPGMEGEVRPPFQVFKPISEALSGKFEVADEEIEVSLPEEEVTAHFFKKEDGSYVLVLWNTDGYATKKWFERKKWKELPTNNVKITLPLETGAGKMTKITYGSSPEDSNFIESSDFSFSNGEIKTTIEKGEVIIYQFSAFYTPTPTPTPEPTKTVIFDARDENDEEVRGVKLYIDGELKGDTLELTKIVTFEARTVTFDARDKSDTEVKGVKLYIDGELRGET